MNNFEKRKGHHDRGVLYIVFGEHYVEEALISAESVKKCNPKMHITVMTDRSVGNTEYVDNVIMIKAKHIRAKVDYIHLTPYKYTLFLDSDTIVDHDVTELFGLLEKYDFGICHDFARKRENIASVIPEYDAIPYSFSEVNPGVVLFENNQNTQKFFKMWRELFYRYQDKIPWEQPTFRVAMWQCSMNFYILPPEYNARSKICRRKQIDNHSLYGEDHLKIRIYHMHANTMISTGVFQHKTLDKCIKLCKEMVYPI